MFRNTVCQGGDTPGKSFNSSEPCDNVVCCCNVVLYLILATSMALYLLSDQHCNMKIPSAFSQVFKLKLSFLIEDEDGSWYCESGISWYVKNGVMKREGRLTMSSPQSLQCSLCHQSPNVF